jgi:hypothetical protein
MICYLGIKNFFNYNCNFIAFVKRPPNYITPIQVQKVIAFLLLLLFLFIPFIEAFHHHPIHQGSVIKEQAEKLSVTWYKNKITCRICDYLKNGDRYPIVDHIVSYTVFLPSAILKSKELSTIVISALIYSYANKGPPSGNLL